MLRHYSAFELELLLHLPILSLLLLNDPVALDDLLFALLKLFLHLDDLISVDLVRISELACLFLERGHQGLGFLDDLLLVLYLSLESLVEQHLFCD